MIVVSEIHMLKFLDHSVLLHSHHQLEGGCREREQGLGWISHPIRLTHILQVSFITFCIFCTTMSTPPFKKNFKCIFVEDRKCTTNLWKMGILRTVRQVEVHFSLLKSEFESLQEKEIYPLPLKQNNGKQEHKQCILEEMLAIKKNMYLRFTECQTSKCLHLEEQLQLILIHVGI